jgi:hypothetical protein
MVSNSEFVNQLPAFNSFEVFLTTGFSVRSGQLNFLIHLFFVVLKFAVTGIEISTSASKWAHGVQLFHAIFVTILTHKKGLSIHLCMTLFGLLPLRGRGGCSLLAPPPLF